MKSISLVAVVCIISALAGCATIKGLFTNNQAELQLAVQIATDAVITAHPADAPKITSIVQATQAAITSGTLVNGTLVAQFVTQQLSKQNLTVADQLIMNELLAQIQQAIMQAFTNAKITTTSDQMVEINSVLTWVLSISSLPTATH